MAKFPPRRVDCSTTCSDLTIADASRSRERGGKSQKLMLFMGNAAQSTLIIGNQSVAKASIGDGYYYEEDYYNADMTITLDVVVTWEGCLAGQLGSNMALRAVFVTPACCAE